MLLTSIRRHKIVTFFLSLTFVLLLFMVGLIFFSESIIKFLTESKGSKSLGRELIIGGDFTIDWHWKYTHIHAEKIRLSNALGYPEADMMKIEQLDFSFKPLKLLFGTLEFGDITLDEPFLVLDKKSAKDNNWSFPILSDAKVASEAVLAEDRYDFPIFKSLNLKSGNFIYRDALKGMDLNVKLESVSGQGGNETAKEIKEKAESGKAFTISGVGTMQGQKFSLDATGGALDTLRSSNLDYPLTLKMAMGATKISVEGTFKDPIKLSGVDASLNITGHNMADLFYITAIPLPITPPYVLKGRLTKIADVWRYGNFKGRVGGSDLAGDLSYDTSNERGFLKANLVSNLMDIRDLGGFIGLVPSGENAAPEQKKLAENKKANAKLIPDVPLKLERLRATNLDVTLKALKIVAPGLPFKGMEIRFNLKDGLLNLNPFKVVLEDGTIEGNIQIDANKDIPPMKMSLGFHKLSLGQFFTNTQFAKTTEGFLGGKLNLSGAGVSLADVLATSDGDVTVIMSGGKISLLLIEASDLDIAQALPLFLGKDKSTKIRCGVTDFEIKDGILTSKVVVLDTSDSLLLGNVKINMKNELISAKLDAKPKDSSIFSAQIPITLSGSLKSPSVGLDNKKIAKKGAATAILSSILSPFAALIPFIEIGEAENADCRMLITNAQK